MDEFFNLIIQDSPEFDLVFDHGSDQWVAASSAEKCVFIQILYHLCQHYWKSHTELNVTVPLVGQKPTSTTTPASLTSSTPASTSTEQTAVLEKKKKKSRDALRPTEFFNCQSKLLGGKNLTSCRVILMLMITSC